MSAYQSGQAGGVGTPLEDYQSPTPDYTQAADTAAQDHGPSQGPVQDVAGGTQDRMPEAQTPTNPGGLTSMQILQAKRLEAQHQAEYHPTSYQSLNPVDRQKFVSDMTQSAWGQGFMAEHGVSPQQFTQMIQGGDPSYSYVDAWKRGLIPQQAGQHWRDRADDGTWLKSPDHPAAWMEYYQAVTGRDPVEDGVDARQYHKLMYGQQAGGTRLPDQHVAALKAEAQQRGIDPQRYVGAVEATIDHLKSPEGRQKIQQHLAGLFGNSQPNQPAPKMRDGQPVGPDGYTDSEREYMRGAGVDPSQKPAAPATVAPAQPQAPAGLGTRKRQQQEDLERIQRGQDPLQGQKRSRLGATVIAKKATAGGVDGTQAPDKPTQGGGSLDGSQAPKRPRRPEDDEPGVLIARPRRPSDEPGSEEA